MVGSYFPYYFTKDLKISMSQVAFWAMLSNMGYFLTARAWGKKIDRASSPLGTLFWASLLVSFSPLFYAVFGDQAVVKSFAPFEFFINGVGWGGFYLSLIALLFRVVPEEKTTIAFSLFSCVIGLSSALFTFLGGELAHALSQVGGFRVLWALGGGLRFLVIFLLFKKLLVFKKV